ncbi:MAG TPA: hypothetical protein VD860_02010 [Azospirillum sp.]|nr:hypothetical protein [Azospirillum sp.]
MDTANINDPRSVEAVYPRSAFEQDARLNAQDKTTVQHGLTLLTAPDAEGRFGLTRANRHVGEVEDGHQTVFLGPQLPQGEYGRFAQDDTDYGGPVEQRDPPDDGEDPYRAFIADVIRAARATPPVPPIPAERLQGFRGG